MPGLSPELRPPSTVLLGRPGLRQRTGWRAPLQPGASARKDPGLHPRFSILPPAWKQSPGSLQAAPREVLLEDCAEEPRIRAQARCRAEEKGKGVDAGPLSERKRGGREEARKGFGEGVEE